MYIYTYFFLTYIYIYIYVYMYVCLYIYIYIYIYIYQETSIYMKIENSGTWEHIISTEDGFIWNAQM
jgi:hypothetical protein